MDYVECEMWTDEEKERNRQRDDLLGVLWESWEYDVPKGLK